MIPAGTNDGEPVHAKGLLVGVSVVVVSVAPIGASPSRLFSEMSPAAGATYATLRSSQVARGKFEVEILSTNPSVTTRTAMAIRVAAS